MPKVGRPSDSRIKKEVDDENEATTTARNKFKGELSKVYDTESSDSDDYRPKNKSPKKTKGDRPARRQKMRVSHFVKEPVQPAFVMKLFDRSVDLTQFSPDTPLYPICRAWFRNNPKDSVKRDPYKKKEEKTSVKDVFRLPPPLPISDEFAASPIPQPKISDDFSVEYDPVAPLPTRDELLERHIESWAVTRARFRNASFKRERRYKDSLTVLRNLNYSRM